MKNFFVDKLEYNHFSNQQLISLIEGTPLAYTDRAKSLIGHTLNAQNIWNHRIVGEKPTQSTWETFDIDELSGLNDKNHAMSNVIVGQFDLRTLIDYKNSSGESFSNSVENILYHIINHSTYHRGQLMTELKQNGATPLSTDYIFYHRK